MPRARPPVARPSKKGKSNTPETADDYQDLADEEEARGGKWRAGDPAKSARAFERAIAFYNQGLQHYPDNFDLAYNKARLEFEISQQPALLPHWGLALLDFLAQALQSHRQALVINDDDVDLLFNTAQVLTSLAEELAEADRDEDAIKCLHEALESLSSCLSKQEMLLEQQSVDREGAVDLLGDDDDDGGGGVKLSSTSQTTASKDNGTEQSTAVEESATIIQPVTPNDLLDTVHASLTALMTLVGLEEEPALANLDSLAQTLYETKAASYLALVDQNVRDDAFYAIALSRAVFVCALADARFTAHAIDVSSLLGSIDTFDIANRETHADGLSAEAKARMDMTLSMMDRLSEGEDMPVVDYCWRQLSLAQESLSMAAKLQDDPARQLKAQIYLRKGDAELLRIRIASMPSSIISDSIRNSRSTLLKNAKTFYTGAERHATATDDEHGVLDDAKQRSAVVDVLIALDSHDQPAIAIDLQETFDDLVNEGLLEGDIIDRVRAMAI